MCASNKFGILLIVNYFVIFLFVNYDGVLSASNIKHPRRGRPHCASKFLCNNGQCINVNLVCNGATNCEDGSDETTLLCSSMVSQENSFRCTYGAYVNINAKCNGAVDCADGSDEASELCEVRPIFEPPRPIFNRRVGCQVPRQPDHGKYETIPKELTLYPGQIVSDGSILVYSCDNNYALSSMKTLENIFCVDGLWDKKIPTCNRTCPPVTSHSVVTICEYKNRNVNCSLPVLEGTRLTMSCRHNYEFAGATLQNTVSVCSSGTWSNEIIKCVPGCGKVISQGEYVLSGNAAENMVLPWHVGIYKKSITSETFEQVCGGSLITMNIVLSAAHCFTDDDGGAPHNITQFRVVAGKFYRSMDDARDKSTAQISNIKQVKITDNYKGSQNYYRDDIAVVVLETPFMVTHVVQPVCLDWTNQYEEEQLFQDSYGDIAAWSSGTLQTSPNEELKHLRMPFSENRHCYDKLPIRVYSYLTSDKFCVIYTNGSRLCKSDGGSGLSFLRNSNKRYYIRGLLGTGPNNDNRCEAQKFTLFTKVSAFSKLISQVEAENKLE